MARDTSRCAYTAAVVCSLDCSILQQRRSKIVAKNEKKVDASTHVFGAGVPGRREGWMSSDKMPTRREGEASSHTAVCAAKTVKKETACGCWRFWPTTTDKQNRSNKIQLPSGPKLRVERCVTAGGRQLVGVQTGALPPPACPGFIRFIARRAVVQPLARSAVGHVQ